MTDIDRTSTRRTLSDLRAGDPSDMYSAIRKFPEQIRTGLAIAREAPRLELEGIRRVLILGMGGSAIGGDLLRTYVSALPERNGVDIVISRGYVPPPTDRSTLLVGSSYSGNTEETLDAYERAHASAGAVLVLTTGGRMGAMADRLGHPRITLPTGLQPRAALAYSFFPLLHSLVVRSELFGARARAETERGIDEVVGVVERLGAELGETQGGTNPAYDLAVRVHGTIPVVYSASDRLDTVNLRWRGQIQENAKHLAFGNVLPEMNHNEINGWLQPEDLLSRHSLVFLHDRDDHPSVAKRLEITSRILGDRVHHVAHVESRGESLLARMFSLVHLGDWFSYYLAVLNGQDPTPVPVIEDLKVELAAASRA